MTNCSWCKTPIVDCPSKKPYGAPEADCWCSKEPAPAIDNFGCLCRRCRPVYTARTWRYHAIERGLARYFEERGYEVEEDEFDAMWKATDRGQEFNLTELANQIMEEIDRPHGGRVEPPQP